MSRQPVSMRTAGEADIDFLAECWSTSLRKGTEDELRTDVHEIVKLSVDDPCARAVIAEYDGVPAGSLYLRASQMTPLNLDTVVHVAGMYVLPQFRRHGIGHALMEQALCFADGLGATMLATEAPASSRETNRFLARLGMGQCAVERVAPCSTIRAKLSPSGSRPAKPRQLTHLLAVRRSLRNREAAVAPGE